jgi:nuclear migration protein JNM1
MPSNFEGGSKLINGVDPSNLTFRPRLPPLRNAHASSSSSSDSEPERIPRTKESAVTRIRRLKSELAELEQEVSTSTAPPNDMVEGKEGRLKRRSVFPPREPLDLLRELSGLRERLSGLDEGSVSGVRVDEVAEDDKAWRIRLGRLGLTVGDKPENGLDEERSGGAVAKDESGDRVMDLNGLSELDKRLASLENVIGPFDTGLDSVCPLSLTNLIHLTDTSRSPHPSVPL